MGDLGKYISSEEYFCSCCGLIPPDFYDEAGEIAPEYTLLFRMADEIREEFGAPIKWSGFRCNVHNKEVGGNPMSIHLFGLALDGDVPTQEDAKRLAEIAKRHPYKPRVGWKKYLKKGQSFVHIDLGFLIAPRATRLWKRGAEW